MISYYLKKKNWHINLTALSCAALHHKGVYSLYFILYTPLILHRSLSASYKVVQKNIDSFSILDRRTTFADFYLKKISPIFQIKSLSIEGNGKYLFLITFLDSKRDGLKPNTIEMCINYTTWTFAQSVRNGFVFTFFLIPINYFKILKF